MKLLFVLAALSLSINTSVYSHKQFSYCLGIESNDTLNPTNAVEVQLGQITGFIFSKDYVTKYFKGTNQGLDLSKEIIEELETELRRQYIESSKRFMKIRYQEMYAMKVHRPDAYDWKELKKSERQLWKYYRKNKTKILAFLNYSVRQYMGYVKVSGEKIVKIILIDLRDDPDNFSADVARALILGCGDWFEANVKQMHFHLDSKKITVNEDF